MHTPKKLLATAVVAGTLACAAVGATPAATTSTSKKASASTSAAKAASTGTSSASIVQTAGVFLASLSAAEIKTVQFAWTDTAQKQR